MVGARFMATPELRRARMERGEPLVDFADRLGLSKGMVSKIERAERHVTPDRARQIAAAFGVQLKTALARGWFRYVEM